MAALRLCCSRTSTLTGLSVAKPSSCSVGSLHRSFQPHHHQHSHRFPTFTGPSISVLARSFSSSTSPADADSNANANANANADSNPKPKSKAKSSSSPPKSAKILAVGVSRNKYSQFLVEEGHKLIVDKPVAAGGENKGASPFDHFLAALMGCEQSMIPIVAAEMKINIGKVKWQATLSYNPDESLGKSKDAASPIQKVMILAQVAIHGPNKTRTVAQLQKAVESRSPLFSMVKNSGVDVKQIWIPLVKPVPKKSTDDGATAANEADSTSATTATASTTTSTTSGS